MGGKIQSTEQFLQTTNKIDFWNKRKLTERAHQVFERIDPDGNTNIYSSETVAL